jgi:hypothetical protein
MADELKSAGTEWAGDVMGRKAHAKFLSAYIEKRMADSAGSLTVAIDAPWGAGKTFFITRWAEDLKSCKRGVMVFDAWKHDTSSDAVVGFMAELQRDMQVLRGKVPASEKAAAQLKELSTGMLKAMRKVVVPVGGALLAGVVKKGTGIVVSDLVDAMQGGDLDFDMNAIEAVSSKELEKSLDLFFKKTLEEHRSRGKATETFRLALQMLVEQLRKAEAIDGPLYVFVDELDRCRPDYAIRLLEGIKHLFAVPGVVFIVSTNLEQLGNSVQAIYGPAFDGTGYLKRFFDFESALPEPNNFAFAQTLVSGQPAFAERATDQGSGSSSGGHDLTTAKCFQLIADAFDLTLRKQERVYVMAAAASAGIPMNQSIALVWLFFLAALRQERPADFKAVSTLRFETGAFDNMVKTIGGVRGTILKVASQWNNEAAPDSSLSAVLTAYYSFTRHTARELSSNYLGNNEVNFPASLLAEHIRSTVRINGEQRLALNSYYQLVQSAGYLAT